MKQAQASCCALGRYGSRLVEEEMTLTGGPVRNVGSWLEPSLGARVEKYTAQRDLCRAGSMAPTSDLTR